METMRELAFGRSHFSEIRVPRKNFRSSHGLLWKTCFQSMPDILTGSKNDRALGFLAVEILEEIAVLENPAYAVTLSLNLSLIPFPIAS